MKLYEKILKLQKDDYEILRDYELIAMMDSRKIANYIEARVKVLDDIKHNVAKLEFELTELESCIAHKDRFIDNLNKKIKELESKCSHL